MLVWRKRRKWREVESVRFERTRCCLLFVAGLVGVPTVYDGAEKAHVSRRDIAFVDPNVSGGTVFCDGGGTRNITPADFHDKSSLVDGFVKAYAVANSTYDSWENCIDRLGSFPNLILRHADCYLLSDRFVGEDRITEVHEGSIFLVGNLPSQFGKGIKVPRPVAGQDRRD